jgi:hypothetical protein
MAPRARSNLVPYYASEIKQRWQKVLESIFEVADLLREAKKKLDPTDWEALQDELPFSDSVATKLLKIGDDKRLRKARVYKLLPSSYSIIYEIHQLKADELKLAIKDGQISPRMHRARFIKWCNEQRFGPPKVWQGVPIIAGPQLKNAFAVLVMMHDPETYKPHRVKKANDELNELAKRYNLLMFPGAEQRPVFQRERTALAQSMRAQFYKIVAPFNKAVDQDERDRIEDALWQHRIFAADEKRPYSPDQASSIENELHPFSTKTGWDYRRLLDYAKTRKIITPWNPIKDQKGLGKAKHLQSAIRYLESSDFHARERNKQALMTAIRLKSEDFEFARKCLKQLTYL